MKAVRDAACLETALRAVRGRLRDIFRELRIEEHEPTHCRCVCFGIGSAA